MSITSNHQLRFLSFLQVTAERGYIYTYICKFLPVSNENLPSVHHLSQRNGPVMAPVVESSVVVDEDDKVFGGTLVKDLGVVFVAASHGE